VIRELMARSHAGAMLYDARYAGQFDPSWFAPPADAAGVSGSGRGASWFVAPLGEPWVLRHYRRGGAVARLISDRYLWTGAARSRPFAEFRLTAALHAAGAPVPRPVAARIVRSGLAYRGDLITARLDAGSLSAKVGAPLVEAEWRAAGASVARCHGFGLDHADLNLHNLLVATDGAAFVIDLDRGRQRAAGSWREANLARLRRSLDKLAAGRWDDATRDAAWASLREGYAAG
jgi:3-deoxy-D-manno-octulosonic acid kinase